MFNSEIGEWFITILYNNCFTENHTQSLTQILTPNTNYNP